MFNKLLTAMLLLASTSAFATTVHFKGYDNPGLGLPNTVKIDISSTSTFNLSGEVDPSSWFTWIKDKNSGLAYEGKLISDKGDTFTWAPVATWSDVDPTVWTFNFSNLAAGNYTLQFNLAGGGSYTGSYTITAVPEPETYGMMLMGLGLMGTIAFRRKQVR